MPLPDAILPCFPALHAVNGPAERVGHGLINETWVIPAGPSRFVVQRVHPVFPPPVNDDVAALVPVLRDAGVPVPVLLRTVDGHNCHTEPDGEAAGTWRAMTWLPGRTVTAVETLEQVRTAAGMLGRFHAALANCRYSFSHGLPDIHDTPRHIAALKQALADHPTHRLAARVQPLAADVLDRLHSLGDAPELPRRIGHGDPKISNFLFDAADAVTGLVDLDTLNAMRIDNEVGDALRSWCNTAGEHAPEPVYDLDRHHTALAAWLDEVRGVVTPRELSAIPAAVERICLELTARFAADALAESYWRWDPAAAPSPGEHNLLRAQRALELACSVRGLRGKLAV